MQGFLHLFSAQNQLEPHNIPVRFLSPGMSLHVIWFPQSKAHGRRKIIFSIYLKKDWLLQWLKQEGEDEKLQLWEGVCILINPPLLGMPLMAPSSDKEGNLSA